MTKTITKGDRVLVANSELNPLTNFYVIKEFEKTYRCQYSYGVVTGASDIPKYNVSKHPIQVSEFTFRMWMNGPELPELNDFSQYITKLKHPLLALRIPLFCIKEILSKLQDKKLIEQLREGLHDCFISDETITDEIGVWVIDLIKQLPQGYKCQHIIEFSGEAIPAAVFNSSCINDDFSISIFLLFFIVAVLKLEIASGDNILEAIDNKLSEFG